MAKKQKRELSTFEKALKFVGSVSKNATLSNNWMHGGNFELDACYPVDIDIKTTLNIPTVNKFLKSLDERFSLSKSEESLLIKSSEMGLDILGKELEFHASPVGACDYFPECLLPMIKKTCDIPTGENKLSDNALLFSNVYVVTNTKLLLEFNHGQIMRQCYYLPKLLLKAIKKINQQPIAIGQSENMVSVYYEAGILTARFDPIPWVDYRPVLYYGEYEPIPWDFRQAITNVLKFSSDVIELGDKIRSGDAFHEIALNYGGKLIEAKEAKLVLDVGTEIHFDENLHFLGDSVRGTCILNRGGSI